MDVTDSGTAVVTTEQLLPCSGTHASITIMPPLILYALLGNSLGDTLSAVVVDIPAALLVLVK